MSLIINLLPTM